MSEVPEAAVEAALKAHRETPSVRSIDNPQRLMRAALEAALPHLGTDLQIVTTAEQLATLPEGTVMRTRSGELAETGQITGGPCVWENHGWFLFDDAIEHLAPLTILYTPPPNAHREPSPSWKEKLHRINRILEETARNIRATGWKKG